MVTTVTQTCDTEKIIEYSRINNIIQHGNNMLVLWKAYIIKNRSLNQLR